MNKIRKIAWERFSLNSSIIADGNGRLIAMLFYFTILVPFGLLSTLLMNPLQTKRSAPLAWHKRQPLPADIQSAREQG